MLFLGKGLQRVLGREPSNEAAGYLLLPSCNADASSLALSGAPQALYSALGSAEPVSRLQLRLGNNALNLAVGDTSDVQLSVRSCPANTGSSPQGGISLSFRKAAADSASRSHKLTCMLTSYCSNCFLQSCSMSDELASTPVPKEQAFELHSGDWIRLGSVEGRVFFPRDFSQETSCCSRSRVSMPPAPRFYLAYEEDKAEEKQPERTPAADNQREPDCKSAADPDSCARLLRAPESEDLPSRYIRSPLVSAPPTNAHPYIRGMSDLGSRSADSVAKLALHRPPLLEPASDLLSGPAMYSEVAWFPAPAALSSPGQETVLPTTQPQQPLVTAGQRYQDAQWSCGSRQSWEPRMSWEVSQTSISWEERPEPMPCDQAPSQPATLQQQQQQRYLAMSFSSGLYQSAPAGLELPACPVAPSRAGHPAGDAGAAEDSGGVFTWISARRSKQGSDPLEARQRLSGGSSSFMTPIGGQPSPLVRRKRGCSSNSSSGPGRQCVPPG